LEVVLVTLIATFAIQTGYFLWKVAADSLPRVGEARVGLVVRGFLTSWKWMLGLLLTIIGWVLFVKATDLGEVSLVQPLMSIGDLLLVLLAIVFLNERLTRIEWLGLALTVVGAATLSFEAEIVRPAVIDWFRVGLFLALAAAAWSALLLTGRHHRRPEVPLAVAVGIGFGTGAVLTELMTAYIALGGRSLESAAFLFNPILPFMVAANVAGLVLLQAAFQRGRAAVVIPVQLSVVNGIAVAAGALVFSEAISGLRLLGIALIVVGTAMLHGRAHAETPAASR
jgi:uncharacterized membrane protein